MSRRVTFGGRLIDRHQTMPFVFDGERMCGHPGDTLASALLANGIRLMGRSFKYHRPRGPLSAGIEEPNALVTVGEGARATPNLRATLVPLVPDLAARSQNRWPSLGFDLGVVADLAARFLPAGFYYKTFMWPKWAWERLYEPLIRRAAGLGPAPTEPDPDHYEQIHVEVDVLVAGGGVAGLMAAEAAARAGARVLVMEAADHWGGRAPVEGETIDGMPAEDWVAATTARLAALGNVTLRRRSLVAGVYDHGHVVALETLDRPLAGGTLEGAVLRQRLWHIRAKRVVNASGAVEQPLVFPGNDRPGVMLASAVRDYLVNWGVAALERPVILTVNDEGYHTADLLLEAGVEVAALVDLRPKGGGALERRLRDRGVRVILGAGVTATRGRQGVKSVTIGRVKSGETLTRIACDGVAMAGGWIPAVHLWSHAGGKLLWDEEARLFRPDPARPPRGGDGAPLVISAGAAAGDLEIGAALASGLDAGLEAAEALGFSRPDLALPVTGGHPSGARADDRVVPRRAKPAQKERMFVDLQNDVKLSDLELAVREGYESVEHAKRYTTWGMATDQAKTSNINGLAALSLARGAPIPAIGTTTFRPPFAPVTFGAIAGLARGPLFKPVRKTAIDGWHEAAGAVWENVADWRRPFSYLRNGDTREEAAEREVLAVRRRVGMFDASTLGKILVKGPDAGRFLDMLYINMMSTLPVGRCRYGVMLNEQGFVIDDGVVVRLAEDTFLCHTTTGGAGHIHGWMEEWLQTEWWDWQVFVLDQTEQFSQIAIAGPEARNVLVALGVKGVDISPEGLPFMHSRAAEIAGIPGRIHRISFSGELSFELSVPADRGLELWEKVAEAGAPFGITPYSTEAMHVLRAEKGYIIVGDETDGTVTPHDLGLGRMISKKKADFIGKRGLDRPFLRRPDRWRLVGLEPVDGRTLLPVGAHATDHGINMFGQRRAIGRVTTSHFSPTLGRPIALGLVERGPDRIGEEIDFLTTEGETIRARITDPVFYDREGRRLHG